MEVNVAINIKVETLFRGGVYFVRGAENSTRGRKDFIRGRRNISFPGDFVMGETLIRDTCNIYYLPIECCNYNKVGKSMNTIEPGLHRFESQLQLDMFESCKMRQSLTKCINMFEYSSI